MDSTSVDDHDDNDERPARPMDTTQEDDNEKNHDDEEAGDDGDDGDSNSAASDNTAEPEYDKSNSLSFATVCRRMEQLWSLKRRKIKPSDQERKKYLLPPQLLKSLEPQSVFPLFRLLMPDIDTARNAAMKEKLIAQAYCDVEGFAKGTRNYEMLFGFTDPQKVPHDMAGDLSLVVQHIMSQRIPNQPSTVTVGQMNTMLDDLAEIVERRRRSYNHEWRQQQQQSQPKSEKKENVARLREQWLRKVIHKGLSPLEHKWLVRILLKKMEFGLGWKALLEWYNPFAMELWHSHNSLKNLCDKLADPEYTQRRMAERERKLALQENNQSYYRWEPQEQPVVLGNTISPMLSSRVYFADCMTKLEWNHKEYLKTVQAPNLRDCLAMNFPAICAETKFDGERMVIHVDTGKVTMQTRNGKWYSQLYSPVLGPPLRRALSKYRVNVILDGEVEAWDDARQERVPFGNNRTVANARRDYMKRHGLLDNIDQNLHVGPDGSITDPNVMRISDDAWFTSDKSKSRNNENDDDESGKQCWLQFLVFDILYVAGPDAKRLFEDCLMNDDAIVPGSLIHYTLLQRKIILHQLLVQQPNEIEIGNAVIIRPNGDCVQGEKYYSVQDPLLDVEGHVACILDSTQTAIQGSMPPNILELDRLRRQGRNNATISRLRAKAVEGFYMTVVEQHKMEGLVLKDLASPYILGPTSRSRKFWHKFKPDYEQGEGIDVIILGAYFATGLRHSGRLSHFLCGVVDESDPSAFMPALCVNGKSTTYENLDKLMELTGFRAATAEEPLQMGKWFECDNHGKAVPDFISYRSFQRNMQEDFNGWTHSKKTYPDLWIRPEDSIVLELKGQEFVPTKEFSAGLTMRFPRIKYVRHDAIDGGAKSAYEVDTHQTLFQLYWETLRQRQEYATSLTDEALSSSTTFSNTEAPMFQSRFLTPEEYARKPKKRKAKTATWSPSKVPKVAQMQSRALAGISVTVLEGNYSFDRESLEAQDAKENGWFDKAIKVKHKEDVMEFLLAHGGTVKVSVDGSDDTLVIGGQANDARVINYMKGIENARLLTAKTKAKSNKAEQLRKLADKEGVLKWTFIFSIVHRWLADNLKTEGVDPLSIPSIKEAGDWLLFPKSFEYLCKSSTNNGILDDIFDLRRDQPITKIELLRALEEYAEQNDKETPVIPWQYETIHSLDLQDRWCVASSKALGIDLRTINLYPDVFEGGFGIDDQDLVLEEYIAENKSERWNEMLQGQNDEIVSVLPLATILGAIVIPHLHRGVTHVLCELESGITITEQVDGKVERFRDQERGAALCSRLKALGILLETKFVSASWVRAEWQKRTSQTEY